MESATLDGYTIGLYEQLEHQLEEIKQHQEDIIIQSELSVNTVVAALKALKAYLLAYQFQAPGEEIHFFKEVKPKFYSLLIYYIKVFNIETERPTGSNEVQRQYLQRELNRLTHFFDNNIEFYRYFRSDSRHLDEKYFLRGQQDIRLSVDAFYYDADPAFSTSHDYKVAKILANEKLRIYLNTALQQLDGEAGAERMPPELSTNITWTASKTDLIELLYGLYAVGPFNDGRLSLKELATLVETAFNIELNGYYRTFLQIRIRKNRTMFIDLMREKLLQRMDDADENPKFQE